MRIASSILKTLAVSALGALLQACGGGGGGATQAAVANNSSGPSCTALAPAQLIVASPSPNSVTVSGAATFDSVPNNSTNGGLDYSSITSKPARKATVHAMSTAGAVLASAVTSDLGAYALAVPANTPYFLRLRAEMVQSVGATTWNIAVKDNTAGDALWVVDSPVANSGTANSVRSINAASGWDGKAYTANRAAGPFAILDTLYLGMKLVNTVQPAAQFAPLTVFWSPRNNTAQGNLAVGEIGTSFFGATNCTGLARFIYILGKQNDDTDEYDSTVIGHEYGHYLQSVFSADASLGGRHSPFNKLDMTLAFSEGWGNAWSSMMRNNPFYLDSKGPGQASGAAFSLATAPVDAERGWYREDSVDTLLYGLFTGHGFAPIWAALTGPMTTQDGLASIFSFASAVRSAGNTAVNSSLNALLSAQRIFAGAAADQWGTGETTNGGDLGNLPVYNSIALNSPTPTCFIASNLTNSSINKLGAAKYYRLTLPSAGQRTFTANFSGGRDIDFEVFQKGRLLAQAGSDSPTSEIANVNLAAGEVVIRVMDFNVASVAPNVPCATLTVN